MCDMSQCVVIVSFPDIFMKFGLCRVVVIDNGTSFKRFRVAMCQTLDLNYDILQNVITKGLRSNSLIGS